MEENYINMVQDKNCKGIKGQGVVSDSEEGMKGKEEALREEIRRLEIELKREKLRADLNEEIINVAEEMFNIQIREKTEASKR